MKTFITIITALLFSLATSRAGFLDQLKSLATTTSLTGVSQDRVTAACKNMMSKAAVSSQFSGLLGSTGLVKPQDMDIDAYVTQKALDGLFTMVAEEEKKIGENPVAARRLC